MNITIFWSVMLCGIYTGTNILVKHAVSIFYLEDGDSRFLQNMCTFVKAVLT